MILSNRLNRRFSFVAKLVCAALLIVTGDRLIYPGSFVGPGIGLFALAWTVLTVASNDALRRDPRAWVATVLALGGSAVLIDDPSLLALAMFVAALMMAALLPSTARFDDAWAWSQRLLLAGVAAIVGPWRNARRLLHERRLVERKPLTRFIPLLTLPVVGGTIFGALFAQPTR